MNNDKTFVIPLAILGAGVSNAAPPRSLKLLSATNLIRLPKIHFR